MFQALQNVCCTNLKVKTVVAHVKKKYLEQFSRTTQLILCQIGQSLSNFTFRLS